MGMEVASIQGCILSRYVITVIHLFKEKCQALLHLLLLILYWNQMAKRTVSTKSEQEGNSSSIDVSPQTPEWSMVSGSPRSGPGFESSPGVTGQSPDWSMQGASPRQSPPIQMMGRPTGYDPNRIPSSIFGGKPASPMDWSVASNESLFSINMGNNSFSRDRAILLGKSGELTTINESNNSPFSPHPVTDAEFNELNNFPSSLPTVPESAADNDRKGADMGKSQVKAGSI
ncbi:hypothetical protein F0562_005147 [Nyssa sinensis]|uniref:Uncharacterized protein n=1 Tax=Nyssa sinensis TaxID=561372 RepID=A0A5J5AJR0_9ASTE|nr:hypothetical protein F0562_005147 [Nyssa sinensis]